MSVAAEIQEVETILQTQSEVVRTYSGDSELTQGMRQIAKTNSADLAELTCRGTITKEWIEGNANGDIHILWNGKTADTDGFAEGEMTGTDYHVHTLCATKGQGGKLLAALEAQAFKQGATKITLDAIPSATGFYEKMGYAQDPTLPPDTVPNVKKQLELGTEFAKARESYAKAQSEFNRVSIETSRLRKEQRDLGAKIEKQMQGIPMIKENKSAGRRRLRLKTLRKSHNKAKKWDAVFEKPDGSTKTVPFGQKGYSDYTKHKNKTRRQRQIDRHSGMGENWKDPATPGALSRYILWNKPTLKGSLRDFKRRFHV